MVVFKSLIVFDAETTSLPHLDHNTTKITELAFIGCEVEHLKNLQGLPRVLHKLVLLFNPEKPIKPEASNISGLTNELLENMEPFRTEDVDILRHFISRLPAPVCLVSHNGDGFDFPILRRALVKLNKDLQNNVYCVDSLKAFRSLLPNTKKPLWTRRSPSEKKDIQVTPTGSRTRPSINNSLEHKNVFRVLFPDEDILLDGISSQETEKRVTHSHSHSPSYQSFKLKDIYYFYYGGYFRDSHRAEEDAKALLSCIKKCEGFFNWMNENAVVFNSVNPLF